LQDELLQSEVQVGDRDRLEDLNRFYVLLNRLAVKVDGPRTLSECNGRMTRSGTR
jgi:hypothetical protein